MEKLMYGPVDIEGHKGLDGRSYIVDTARLFPPAPPVRGIRGCHLYKLLRKELVRSNPVPLSSDAFSFFGKVNELHHNLPVTDAVNRIFDSLIPQFFALPNINEILQGGGDRITREIHDLGINVRFLGCILDYALDLVDQYAEYAQSTSSDASGTNTTSFQGPIITKASINGIIREMICRASKHVFFGSMRTNVRPNFSTKDECRRLAADHWNHLLFSSFHYNPAANVQNDPTKYHLSNEAVDNWWKTQLIPTLKQRFIFFNGNGRWVVPLLAELEEAANRIITEDLVMEALKEDPAAVFMRSTALTGVVFETPLLNTVAAKGNPWFRENRKLLETDHVVCIEVLDKRVKFVPFLSASFEDSERFYLAEIANRVSALGATHPQVAISYRHLGELYADQPGFEENARASYERAAAIYRSYHSKDVEALVRDLGEMMNLQADLLLKYDRLQLAQHKLFELLELYRPVSLTCSSGGDSDTSTGCQSSKMSSSGELQTTSLVMSDGKSLAFVRQITNLGDLEDAANVLDKIAFVKLKLGSFEDASNCFALAYECKIKIFGNEQCWQVARTLNGQAQLLFASGQIVRAKEMCLKVHKITIETRGPGHSEVGIAKDNLARVLSAEGSYDDADELYKAALEIKVASLGEKHSFVAMSWDNMASNRLERLLSIARKEVEKSSGVVALPNSTTVFMITQHNVQPADLEDIALLYEKSLEAIEKSLGKLHSAYGISASNLSVTKAYLRQWGVAERLSTEALAVLSSTLGNAHPSAVIIAENLKFIHSVLSKSPAEQQSADIKSDALRRVYHSSLASSTPSGSSTSSSSNKSRIPDKIKALLEKKGLAVTEENAAKVQELLRRKREAAGASMPGTTLDSSTRSKGGFGAAGSSNTTGKSSSPYTAVPSSPRKPVSADNDYENAPDSYSDVPPPPKDGRATRSQDYESSYSGGYGGVQSSYEEPPMVPSQDSLLSSISKGQSLRKADDGYENVPTSPVSPSADLMADDTDDRVEKVQDMVADINDIMRDLHNQVEEQTQHVDSIERAEESVSRSKSTGVIDRLTAFFSSLIQSRESSSSAAYGSSVAKGAVGSSVSSGLKRSSKAKAGKKDLTASNSAHAASSRAPAVAASGAAYAPSPSPSPKSAPSSPATSPAQPKLVQNKRSGADVKRMEESRHGATDERKLVESLSARRSVRISSESESDEEDEDWSAGASPKASVSKSGSVMEEEEGESKSRVKRSKDERSKNRPGASASPSTSTATATATGAASATKSDKSLSDKIKKRKEKDGKKSEDKEKESSAGARLFGISRAKSVAEDRKAVEPVRKSKSSTKDLKRKHSASGSSIASVSASTASIDRAERQISKRDEGNAATAVEGEILNEEGGVPSSPTEAVPDSYADILGSDAEFGDDDEGESSDDDADDDADVDFKSPSPSFARQRRSSLRMSRSLGMAQKQQQRQDSPSGSAAPAPKPAVKSRETFAPPPPSVTASAPPPDHPPGMGAAKSSVTGPSSSDYSSPAVESLYFDAPITPISPVAPIPPIELFMSPSPITQPMSYLGGDEGLIEPAPQPAPSGGLPAPMPVPIAPPAMPPQPAPPAGSSYAATHPPPPPPVAADARSAPPPPAKSAIAKPMASMLTASQSAAIRARKGPGQSYNAGPSSTTSTTAPSIAPSIVDSTRAPAPAPLNTSSMGAGRGGSAPAPAPIPAAQGALAEPVRRVAPPRRPTTAARRMDVESQPFEGSVGGGGGSGGSGVAGEDRDVFSSLVDELPPSASFGGQQLPPQALQQRRNAPSQAQSPSSSSSYSSYGYGGQMPPAQSANPSLWQTAAHTSFANDIAADRIIQESRFSKKKAPSTKASNLAAEPIPVLAEPELDLDDLDEADLDELLQEESLPSSSLDTSSRVAPNKGSSWGWGAF